MLPDLSYTTSVVIRLAHHGLVHEHAVLKLAVLRLLQATGAMSKAHASTLAAEAALKARSAIQASSSIEVAVSSAAKGVNLGTGTKILVAA